MKLNADAKKFGEIIELAYSSAEDPEPWQRFVDAFRELLQSRSVSINLRRKAGDIEFEHELRYYLVTSDKTHFLAPEYIGAAIQASDRILDLQHPRPEQLPESTLREIFWASPLLKQYLDPLNLKHMMVMDVHRSDNFCIKLSAEKTAAQSPFDHDDKELMVNVVPHLQRAILYQSEKRGGLKLQTFYAHILDKLSLGGILLDEQGGVISTNSTADQVIEAGIGLHLQRGRLLAAESIIEQQALRDVISLSANAARNSVTAQPGKVLGLHSNTGELVLEVVVKPYIVDMLSSADRIPAVSVIISQNAFDDTPVDFHLLSSLYDFTPQEAKVAALIGSGLNINEIAAEMAVSANTTKTHLRAIYSKTGYNRQSQLVALLSRSVARLI